MVAVFTGLGAGFERGSAASLGSGGLLGSSAMGRALEGVFLNAATGNLILSRQDEFLVGRGPDIALARTYNSLGNLDIDQNGIYDLNAQGWRRSTERRIYAPTGSLNAAGSTIKRLSADGSEITYSWNGSAYTTTDGAGAHDKLTYDGTHWTWTDGDSRVTEKYAAYGTDNWRIVEQRSADGLNAVSFYYTADKLDTVTTQDGSYTKYVWSGANIAEVETWYAPTGTGAPNQQLTRTYYTYDAQDRLIQVAVDLTPADNVLGDGDTDPNDDDRYFITYAYDAAGRISTISQTDGSSLSISYDATHRVTQLVQSVGPNDTRTTTIAYHADRTEITDARGLITKLFYDGQKRLTQVEGPPPQGSSTALTLAYTYDGSGNVITATNAAGTTTYAYDAAGNITQITDPNSSVTTRVYNSDNKLTRETRTGTHASGTDPLHTRFAYNGAKQLRYSVTAEGRVTEYKYNSAGLLEFTIQYLGATFSTTDPSPSDNALDAWRNAIADKSASVIQRYYYDGRGNLTQSETYGAASQAGAAILTEGFTDTRYTYDQAGQLLARNITGQQSEAFVYDGLGRVILSTNLAGGVTKIKFDDDVSTTIVSTNWDTLADAETAASYVTTSVYNKAGDLISQTDRGTTAGGDFTNGGTATFLYDKAGQLRMATDATGKKSWSIYDNVGRKIADVGHDGQLSEYHYDQAGRLLATRRYQNKLTADQLTTLSTTTPTEVVLGSGTFARPAASDWDIWQWSVYDAGGRVVGTILGDGSVTQYVYDQADRLVKTTSFFTKLDANTIASFKAAAPAALPSLSGNPADRITRAFYDRDGRLIGALNAEGGLSRVVYDSAGRKVEETAYANLTGVAQRASGTFDQLLASFSADAARDATSRYVYDGQGLLRFTIDAMNRLTELVYRSNTDSLAVGLVRKTVAYANALGTVANYGYATIKAAAAALANAGADRVSHNIYNDRAQLAYSVDALGGVTGFTYNTDGQAIKATQFAAFVNMSAMGTDAQWKANLDSWAAQNQTNVRVTRNYYSERGELRFVVDAEGYVTRHDYDKDGRLFDTFRFATKITTPIPTYGDATTINDIHNANKGSSVWTGYRYDNMGRLQDVWDGTSTRRSKFYYANGQLGWEIVAYGQGGDEQRTQYIYDQSGKLISTRKHTSEATNSSWIGATTTLMTQAQRLLSPNNQYSAVLTRLGELQLIHKGEVIWSSGSAETVANATYRLVAQTDGNLVIYRDVAGQSQVGIWSSNTAGAHSGAAFLQMQNDGNLVLHKGTAPTSTGVIWQTNTVGALAQDPNAAEYYETLYTYDGLGNLATVKDPYNNITSYTYDKVGRVLTQTDPMNGVTAFEYDTLGRVVKTTDARGFESFAYYDQLGRVTLSVDAERYATSNTYNAFGEVASTRRYATQTSGAAVGAPPSLTALATSDIESVFTYDKLSRVLTKTNAENGVSSYQYDAFGKLVRSTDELGHSTYFYYDALGRVKLTVDAENYATQTAYNSLGQVQSVTRRAQRVTGTLGNVNVQPTIVEDSALDAVTSFTYDGAGRVLTQTDAEGGVTTYVYDRRGNAVKITNALGGVTERAYDRLDRLIKETVWFGDYGDVNAQKTTTTFQYDKNGNLLKKVEAGGLRTTLYQYDALNRLTRITHDAFQAVASATAAAASVTPYEEFTYNANGDIIQKRDAAGGLTLYWYDKLGRVTHSLSPLGTLTKYRYDGAGNVIEMAVFGVPVTAPNALGNPPAEPGASRITSYTYDRLGRVTLVQSPSALTASYSSALSVLSHAATTAYLCDAMGNVVRVTDANGGTKHAYYDKLGRKLVEIDAANYRTEWVYNTDGNVVSERRYATAGAAATSTTTPPAAPATSADDRVTIFGYDRMGRRTVEKRLSVTAHTSLNLLNNPAGYPKSAFTSTAAYEQGGVPGWYYWTNDTNGGHSHGANAIAGPAWLADGDASTMVVYQSDAQAGYVYDIGQTFVPVAGQRYVFSAYTGAHRADVEVFIAWKNSSGQYSESRGPAAQSQNLTEQFGGQSLSGYKRLWVEGVAPEWASEGYVVVRKLPTKAGQADSWMFVTRPQLELWTSSSGPSAWADLALDTISVEATISYTYNALGQVIAKREATGEQTAYTYDRGGRLTTERKASYFDYNNALVTPTLDYAYDGLGNLTELRQRGGNGSAAGAADERITTYTYGDGGRLLSMSDATGFTRTYRYDQAGQVRREEYVRVTPTGSSNEAIGYDYDLEGRLTQHGALVFLSGAWTRTNIIANLGETIDTTMMLYNAYGEMIARGLNVAAGDIGNIAKYGERFDYDNAGRLIRTNAGDGVWKYFLYDKNGNQTLMIASEGSDLYHGADANAALTAALDLWTSDRTKIATDWVDGVVATITRYDARNQAIEVIEPQRELSAATKATLRTSRAYNAFGEVIRETNANGHDASGNPIVSASITYTYNTMGRLIRSESPAVEGVGDNGLWISGYGADGKPLANSSTATTFRPVEHRYYDAAGRLVASRDANGNLTKLSLLAGTGYGGANPLVRKATTADGASVVTGFDIHGDARKITDQINRVTLQQFDKAGRLTQATRPTGLVESYAYDGLGQRIKQWNSLLGAGVAEQTTYDHQGRIVQHIAMGGDVTSYAHGWSGALSNAGLGVAGGWIQTTTYANAKVLTEQSDFFAHLLSKTDLSGRVSASVYDKAGRLVQRTGGTPMNYGYFNTGRVAESYTYITNAQGWQKYGSGYTYDKVGNVTAESIKRSGVTDYWTEGWMEDISNNPYEPEYVYHPPEHIYFVIDQTYSNASATYDALGRLLTWTETGSVNTGTSGSPHTPPASITYKYDANGNIRRSTSTFRYLDANGAALANNSTQDYWYRYDALNRVVTQKGVLQAGAIVRGGAGGVDIAYDAAGQRAFTLTSFADVAYVWTEVPNWPESTWEQIPYFFTNTRREDYTYDSGGRLSEVKVAQGSYDEWSGQTIEPSGPGTRRAAFVYDLMDRMTSQIDYEANGTTTAFSRAITYNAKSQITSDIADTRRSNVVYRNSSTFAYGSGASYALGAALTITTANYQNNSYQNTSLTTNSYEWWDGAVQKTIQFKPNQSQSTTHTTTYSYEQNGGQAQLWYVYVQDGRPRGITFRNDMQGQALRRDELDYSSSTNGDPHEIYYRFAGKQIGYVGNNGTLNTDYAASITNRTTTTGTGAFRNGAANPTYNSDFDQSVPAINSYFQGSAGGGYTVQTGDTLQSIAARLWGDASLWWKLAEANGLSGDAALVEGQTLMLPTGAIKNTHNAGTFTPYDPNEIIGDTAPTTPVQPKPKKNKCGGIGAIIVAVIAIVVVAIVAPYAAGAISALQSGATLGAAHAAGMTAAGAVLSGTATLTAGAVIGGTTITGSSLIVGGAIAGAAGSIVSQGIGVATGIQEKFSWNAVALAAISGAVGGATGGQPADWKAAVWQGVKANVITQGIAVATGLQDKFSWAGVAASAVGAGVGYAFGERFGDALTDAIGSTLAQGVTGAAAAIASAGARSLIEGTDFGDNILAALPDVIAQTIGNAITRGIGESILERRYAQNTHQMNDASGVVSDVEVLSVDECQDLTPRERYLRRVEDLQDWLSFLDEMSNAELGPDADAMRLAAAAEAEALYEELKDFSLQDDGILGVIESWIGGAGGTAVGVPQGTVEGLAALLEAVTDPIGTARALWNLGERASDYVSRTTPGEAIGDANVRLRMFDAAIDLEQARIYLTEGNLAAGYFVGNQAGRIVGSVFGPTKLGEVLAASRAARATRLGAEASRASGAGLTIGSLVRSNGALRQELTRIVRGNGANRWTEARGLIFAARQARMLGYEYRASLTYRSNNGIDAVFFNSQTGRYAVWEAKGGTSSRWAPRNPSDLNVDTRGMVTLSDNFIADRLQNALRAAPNGPNAPLIRTLQAEFDAGRLGRFASFRASRSTFEVRPYPDRPDWIYY